MTETRYPTVADQVAALREEREALRQALREFVRAWNKWAAVEPGSRAAIELRHLAAAARHAAALLAEGKESG